MALALATAVGLVEVPNVTSQSGFFRGSIFTQGTIILHMHASGMVMHNLSYSKSQGKNEFPFPFK